MSWQEELAALLKIHGVEPAKKAKGKQRWLGRQTAHLRGDHLFGAWRDLGKLGCQPQSVKNFSEKHVRRLVEYWETKNLSAATLQTRLTTLRTFAGWIGKAGMVRSTRTYVRNPASAVRHYAAEKDKSWTANGVDAEKVIEAVMKYDHFVGHQLIAIYAFGLRRKEGVCFKPWAADKGTCLLVDDGTKGGRVRLVPLTGEKREILEELKDFVGTGKEGVLGDPTRTLEQALTRFAFVMTRFGITKAGSGVTAHGLRHEFGNDVFAAQAGFDSPVRGGDGRGAVEMDVQRARAAVAEVLGHSRIPISNAYLGSFKQILQRIRREREQLAIG